MIALVLIGVAAATMADFNLAATSSPMDFKRFAEIQSPSLGAGYRYVAPRLQDNDIDNDDGIRVKLRWRKVKITIPFGPN